MKQLIPTETDVRDNLVDIRDVTVEKTFRKNSGSNPLSVRSKIHIASAAVISLSTQVSATAE